MSLLFFPPLMISSQEYLYAFAGGLVTWKVLNRINIRGDYAAALLSISLPLYYAYARMLGLVSSQIIAAPAIYLFSIAFWTACYRLSPWHPLASFPGPPCWKMSSLWLTYISYKGRRHLILDELHAKYGQYLRVGPNTMSINSLDAIQIYSAAAGMEKSESYRVPGHLTSKALFFKQATEKIHSDRKKVWSGLFTSTHVAKLLSVLEERAWELLRCIERRQEDSEDDALDLSECMYHWAYDYMGDIIFGGANRLELMKNGDPMNLINGGKKATVILDSVGQSPWLMDIIWHIPAGKEIHRLRQVSASMMHQRLKATGLPPYRDLVSFLQEDSTITIEDLELDAVVAIQGGSDNTSLTMALAMYFLCAKPEYFLTLRKELDKMFPNPLGPLPASQLALLPYLEAVINETLRLGSPFFLPRIVPAGGAMISERFIPEGTVVALAAYSQQISPDNFYPDPLDFHPKRWFPNGMGPETRANKAAISSFSSGPHACIAKAFAYQEMRHIIARLVLTLDFTFAKSFDSKAFRNGILNMRTTILETPLRVKVRRREGLSSSEFGI